MTTVSGNSVLRDTKANGSQVLDSFAVASGKVIPFGAAVVPSSASMGADTIKAALLAGNIIGFAGKRSFIPKGGYDGFWEQYEMPEIITGRAYALVTPNGGNVNIDNGDFLEVASLGDDSSEHGVLEEAGSQAGTVRTTLAVAQALESVTMGSSSYKVPASNVAIGDSTITMTAGDIALMGLGIGDQILLEDLNGDCQVNVVADLTATVITLARPSTVALTTSDNDLVTKMYRCKVRQL